jgi:hypothetical protein
MMPKRRKKARRFLRAEDISRLRPINYLAISPDEKK